MIRTIFQFIFYFFIYINFQNTQGLYAQKKNPPSIADSNLVLIEGGTFRIGNKNGEADEKPSVKIRIENFYIGKYEVTNAEFVQFLNEKGNQYEDHAPWLLLDGEWSGQKCRIYEDSGQFMVEKGYEEFPVNFVSWYGADAYCKWKGGRLPTEAEWEYVVKGGKYSTKKYLKEIQINLGNYAWYSGNSNKTVHQKGQKKANILGIYDIHGNLWEWCNDFYGSEYYREKIKKNPQGPTKGDYKVIRGGSWTNKIEMMEISNRNGVIPGSNKIGIGFRIAYSID